MSSISMADLVATERILPRARVRGREQLLALMVGVAARCAPLDAPRILDSLARRDGGHSYGVSDGIALPHAHAAGLRAPMGVFARVSPPIAFGADDRIPADIVLLLLAPPGEEATLLRAMACAARRLRDPEVLERVRSAGDREAIAAILCSDSWRGLDPGPGRERRGARMTA